MNKISQDKQLSSKTSKKAALSPQDILSIFESVPGLYLILKPDVPRFTVVAVSNAYALATMTKREEILGRGLFEVFPDNPNDPQATGVKNLTASLMSVLKNKKQHKMAIQKYDIPKPKDGFEVRYWSPLNSPVLDKKGNVAYIVHSVIDVTNTIEAEQKGKAAEERADQQEALNEELTRVQQALREARDESDRQKRLYEAITKSTPDLIYVFDLNYRFTYANEALLKMWGKETLDEAIGKRLRELGYEEWHAALHEREIDQVVATKKPIRGEVSFPHATLGRRIYDYILVPILNAQGEVESVAGTTRDITDIKQAEEALRENEERYRELAETTRIIPWESDLETGAFTYVGPQAKTLLGYPLKKWYEPTFWPDHIHPDDRDWVVNYCLTSSKKKTEYEFEYRMLDAKGKSIWLRDIVNVVEGKDKKKKLRGFMLDITERKQYEDEVKESELRFRNLADTAPMYIAMADENGNAIYFNKPWLEYTGNTLEDMLGLGWLRTLHPEDAPKFEKDFKHAFKQQLPINEQYRFRKANGEYRWMLAIGAPRYTPDNRFIGYFGTYTDFHELKETQLAMQESEERFRQLAETIPHIVFSCNADGKVEYVNHKWFEYSGSPQDFDPDSWAAYIHPDDLLSVLSIWKDAKKKGDSYEVEYRLKRHDGIYRWHLGRTSPIKNQHGRIVRWFGTATDIDDRKRTDNNMRYLAKASKVLSASLDFKTTLQNIAKLAVPEIADWCSIDILGEDGLEQVAVVHKDPKKIKWAEELRKKYPPDMNASTGIPKVIRTGEAEFYPFITDEMLAKVARDKEHLKLLRNVGFTSAMVVPLCREGKCVGGITFVTAEAKRQYTESDLKMAMELATRASLALDNAWLYKVSQDAVTLRDDFISVASHELKTPVTSVKIFTEVLQKHSEQIGDQKAAEHLTKMNKQLDKLTELIYNMLNISKIQAGRLEFTQKRFDFDATVKEIVDVLQEGTTKHKLIIEGKTNKKVYGDDDRIGQVLSNLLSNAIKYSPRSDKVIVHLSSTDDEVIVCVEDFGIGLTKEHGEHIFERFYRVFDTTDKTFPGLGIGLYISSEIIRRHHGKLWVESNTGQGSKFYFSLPLNRDKKPNGVKVL